MGNAGVQWVGFLDSPWGTWYKSKFTWIKKTFTYFRHFDSNSRPLDGGQQWNVFANVGTNGETELWVASWITLILLPPSSCCQPHPAVTPVLLSPSSCCYSHSTVTPHLISTALFLPISASHLCENWTIKILQAPSHFLNHYPLSFTIFALPIHTCSLTHNIDLR
jgi:hypothetical protein